MPGPVPKKDAERRRRNKTPEAKGGISHIPAEVVNVDELLVGEVEIPAPDENWHPVATMIYEAQKRSGQVIWMEPSDWAMLWMLCESISRDFSEQVVGITEEGDVVKDIIPLKGASLSSYLKAFNMLLMAEGGRRMLRIELERQKRIDEAASGDGVVVDIVQRRADAFKGA
jgi:hypothetical protein